MQVDEIPNQHETLTQSFHVFCNNGYTATVTARGYKREYSPEDRIEFFNSEQSPLEDYFFRTEIVNMIVPSSSLSHTHNPFTQVEERVKHLAERVTFLESNLPDIIVKAVRAAIRQGEI